MRFPKKKKHEVSRNKAVFVRRLRYRTRGFENMIGSEQLCELKDIH